MKSIFKFLGVVAAGVVGTTGVALALPTNTVPEPGSIALVALGIAGVVLFARRK